MKRILIIDDEVGFTRLLHMNLEKIGGFSVRVVNDSSKALKTARAFKPEVILLDIVMPGLDGGDVSEQLAKDPDLRDIPLIIVSALVGNNETSVGAVAHSGDQVIVAKPVDMQKMLLCIETALASPSVGSSD